MSKKIELVTIAPWQRKDYPELKSKTELRKMKLMPGYNVKPRALVIRKKYDNYYLYDINKTIPYHESQKEKAHKRKITKLNNAACTCKKCGTKFDYYAIKNDYIPFLHKERLCEKCYFKTFRKYKKGIVYDIETTGLYPLDGDEVLSMCIMDLSGNVLFKHNFKPEYLTEWPEAEVINAISPEIVENENPFSFYREEIQQIFDGADILITYNGIDFDDRFLIASGIIIPDIPKFDVMLEYAWSVHLWDSYHKGWKRHKLIDCAAAFDYKFQAHDATEDVRATLHCYRCMTQLDVP